MWWQSDLSRIFPNFLTFYEPLSSLTSWKVGGSAVACFTPPTERELVGFLIFASSNKIPYTVIGGGTNVLVHDTGFKGVVIATRGLREFQAINSNTFVFGAGFQISNILKFAINRNLSGWEHMAGIPGSVGGALIGNAGVKGQTSSDSLVWLDFIDENGNKVRLAKEDVKWDYRYSSLADRPGVIARACFRFYDSTEHLVKNKTLYFLKLRKNQPVASLTAGSVFKNISEDEPAGLLLDIYGCKGKSEGGAMVSNKHANFIVNCNSASALNIWNLIKLCRSIVLEKHGKWLDLEVRLIGGPWI